VAVGGGAGREGGVLRGGETRREHVVVRVKVEIVVVSIKENAVVTERKGQRRRSRRDVATTVDDAVATGVGVVRRGGRGVKVV